MKRVLILGASARAAAQSAVSAGWQVTAADLFADRDLQCIADCVQVARYPEDLVAIRAAHAALPVIYTGALENYPALLEQFRSCGILLGNDADTVRGVRDPFRLRSVFALHGIPFPVTQRKLPTSDHHRWLRKPGGSAGGFRIQRCQPDLVPLRDCYYQEFVDGPVCSAAFVAANQQAVLLGTTEMLVGCRWSGATGFLYSGSILRHPDTSEIEQWIAIGSAIARQGGAVGLYGVDAVIQDGMVVPIEVNPRYTASMEVLERWRGSSLVGWHIEACVSGSLPGQISEAVRWPMIGKLILYANSEIRFPQQLPELDQDTTLADLPRADTVIAAGQPMLTLIVCADCRSSLLDTLRTRAQQVYDQLNSWNVVRSR